MKYIYILFFIILLITVVLIILGASFSNFKKHHLTTCLDKHIYFCYNPLYQQKILNLFKEIKNVFDKQHYTYFLTGGSLLGCLRNNSIIPHDDDIDIAIMEEDLIHLKNSNILPSHLILKKHYSGLYKIYSQSNKNVFIDLFILKKKGYLEKAAGIYTFTGRAHFAFPKQFWFEHELFPLKKKQFNNLEVPIPFNSHPYLNRTYGQNWNKNYVITHFHKSLFSNLLPLLFGKKKIQYSDELRECIDTLY